MNNTNIAKILWFCFCLTAIALEIVKVIHAPSSFSIQDFGIGAASMLTGGATGVFIHSKS